MAISDLNSVIEAEGFEVIDKAFIEVAKVDFAYQIRTDGISSLTQEVSLPGNAVVRRWDVEVEAVRADETPLENAGQVRTSDATDPQLAGSGMTVVVDFGVMRTVTGVRVESGLSIWRIKAWMGTGFPTSSIYHATLSTAAPKQVTASAPSTRTMAVFPEVRTERLLVDLLGTASAASLASSMSVLLPEAPADLELRFDGATPAWSWPGPVQPGPGTALTAESWNSAGKRLVDLGPALAALTGDPTATTSRTFKLVLSSRVPGVLGLTPKTQTVSYIRRALFNGEATRELSFTAEGQLDVDLETIVAAGSSRAIEELRLTAIAKLPPERVIPPVGPEVASAAGVPVLAELTLDPQHSAAIRVPAATGLEELTALRLPLTPGASGAEARVVLWSADPATGEPLEPLKQGSSEPVQLEAGAAEAWYSFPFKKAVALDEAARPWVVLVATRGAATWSLGVAATGEDLSADNRLRRGPPAGPWSRLPGTFQTGSLKHLRGRMRVVGHAPSDRPVAPLTLTLVGASGSIELTPTQKGTAATLSFSPALTVTKATLRVTSRTPGSVTLKDIDVISTT